MDETPAPIPIDDPVTGTDALPAPTDPQLPDVRNDEVPDEPDPAPAGAVQPEG